jgi:Zn-dependent protease
MGRGSVRIGRLAGIPIGVQPLWLAIVALITWSLGASFYPDAAPGIAPAAAYALGLLSALLLFASILLHELGHAVVARRHGVEIEEIDLWLLGGVARMKGYPKTAGDELRFALAGPAVTLVIAGVFGAIAAALPASAPDALRAVVDYQAFVNAAILVFNLLPAFPLDGGRVARALLWGRSGDLDQATAVAARLGRGFGYGMIGLGVFGAAAGALGGLWLAVVGLFVIVAAKAEESGLRVREAFSGREAGRLMSYPAVTIPIGLSVETAVERFFVPYRYTRLSGARRRAGGRAARPARGRAGAARRATPHQRRPGRDDRPGADRRRARGRRRADRATRLPARRARRRPRRGRGRRHPLDHRRAASAASAGSRSRLAAVLARHDRILDRAHVAADRIEALEHGALEGVAAAEAAGGLQQLGRVGVERFGDPLDHLVAGRALAAQLDAGEIRC